MKIWLDTINLECIKEAANCGIIAGITTNPDILSFAKPGHIQETLDHLLALQAGPVAVQVTAQDSASMIAEARSISCYSPRLLVKIFADKCGYAAMKTCYDESIPFIATGIFEPMQALISANLGAAYIAPYFSRIGETAKARKTLESMVAILRSGQYRTQILAASVNRLDDLIFCAELGVEAITIKEDLYQQLVSGCTPLQSISAKFLSAWRNRQGNTSLEELRQQTPSKRIENSVRDGLG